MSNTYREITFSVTIRDPDRWTEEHRRAAERSDGSLGYDDWVIEQLKAPMVIAGARFMVDNPDLFAHQDLL